MSSEAQLKLEPCERCGARPAYDHTRADGVRFGCLECEERTFEDFEQAAEFWNKRHDSAPISAEVMGVIERLERQHRDGILNLPDDWQWVSFLEAATLLRIIATKAARAETVSSETTARWINRMADVREASGIGVTPMLNEVPAAIKARFDAIESRLADAMEALKPFSTFNLDGFDGIVLEVVPADPKNPAHRIEPILKCHFERARALASGDSEVEKAVAAPPPWPPGNGNNAKRAGWQARLRGDPRTKVPFPRDRPDLRTGFEEGWDAADSMDPIDGTGGSERCIACGEPFRIGDEYLVDVSGGAIHFACCGPEPEGFVNLETGEPLEEPPKPLIWDEKDAGRG